MKLQKRADEKKTKRRSKQFFIRFITSCIRKRELEVRRYKS